MINNFREQNLRKNNKLKMYMLIDRKNNKTKIILAKNMLG